MTDTFQGSLGNGSFGGDNSKLKASDVLECKICWWQYQPEKGDAYWQIPAGTPFANLPDHWSCPNCDGRREDFMVVE